MWIKVLGVLCAGVFVGAALVEAVQLKYRRKLRRETADAEEQGGAQRS